MSYPDLSRLLAELNERALELNVESNSINSVISSVEHQIRNANVGIEVWLEGDQAIAVETTFYYDHNARPVQGRHETQIGFAKLDEAWSIAVREKTSYADGKSRVGVSPLLKASRDTRLAALEKLPALIIQLRTAAENAVAAIRQARKLIE
ncbi:MAG: hypothetical protein ACHQZS_01775 [Candidatus Binatales bacterium]